MSRSLLFLCAVGVGGVLAPFAIADEPKSVLAAVVVPAVVGEVEVDVADGTPDENTAKLIQQIEKERQEAAKSLQKVRETAPFQQDKAINVAGSGSKILGFCVLKNGTLAVISGAGESYGSSLSEVTLGLFGGKSNAKNTPSRVQWLDADGKVLQSADLDFKPKAVNSAPDGTIYVVGEGIIARFDAAGKKLAQATSPHIAEFNANREKFTDEVMERHEENVAATKEQVDQLAAALKELEGKPADQLSKQEKASLAQTKAIVGMYQKSYEATKALTREQVVEQALTKLKELHRVAVSDKDLFVVTNEATGYGYCVWRLTHDLKEPKKVVSKLSGCCGQMDVQIAGEGLAIAENSRHRVLLVDRDGKTIRSFGETSRTDVTKGFGGCCNPMNTCLDAAGGLLTSESNGLVKRYNLAGEFQAIMGVAKVTEGCKNSSIGISPKGDRLYYFDVEHGQILVLNKPS